jgi:hypothetical protein
VVAITIKIKKANKKMRMDRIVRVTGERIMQIIRTQKDITAIYMDLNSKLKRNR